jgi:pyruvate/2-oxoglutarate/acetoin dehydrogenase E1 component
LRPPEAGRRHHRPPPPTGLFDEFGANRVIDTPISETGFIGPGIGAAIEGLRPVVELMFIDFYGVCMDQITNHMAKIHYESGGNVTVPMVLMAATGAGYSDAAQHSQCLWGTFAHLPGIKVVVVIAEHDPAMLKRPFRRLAVPDVPIPYARVLEQGILPTREKIAAGVRALTA